MMHLDRREFLGFIAAAGVARAIGPLRPVPPILRISFASSDREVERGASMAVDEARRSAELFGGTVVIGDGPGLRVVVGGVPARPVDEVYMNVVDLKPDT